MLLDLKLPQIKGLDVLKRVRQLSDRGPIIIILSSSKCEMDISEAYRLGANAYLNKARDLDGLIELVRAIDGFWLKHNLVATMTDGMDEFGSGEEGRLTA
jgi:DNA-binding response OmpR family regulator